MAVMTFTHPFHRIAVWPDHFIGLRPHKSPTSRVANPQNQITGDSRRSEDSAQVEQSVKPQDTPGIHFLDSQPPAEWQLEAQRRTDLVPAFVTATLSR